MNMAAIAKGFGVDGEVVENPAQLREALARARKHTVEGKPYLIDAQVARKGVAWADKPWSRRFRSRPCGRRRCKHGNAARARVAWWRRRLCDRLFPALPAPARRRTMLDQGRGVYDDFCASCHGRDMINPGGVTFDLRKFPKGDFERFRNVVLDGKAPAMPPWRDKVSDEDVKLLWAYVRNGG